MEAIEILMSEHRTIERVIDALLDFVEEVRRGADDKAELGRFVRFIREFADGLHHAKEEGQLFEAMVQAGFPRQAGPIAVMLHDHDLGRRYVAALAELAESPEPWSAAEREALAGAATGYGELLRGHIHKEDAILYPMAEQRLPPMLAAAVDAGCAGLDEAAGTRRVGLERLAAELVSRHAPGMAGLTPAGDAL